MWNKLITAVFVWGIMSVAVFSQDIHFSQFYMAPLHLNPAMTGVMKCNHRFAGNYRSQWGSVIDNPFNTYSASYDTKMTSGRKDYFGLGLSLWGDEAGAANFSTVQGRFSGSYSKYITGNRNAAHYLVVGADLAYSQRSINFAKLQWGTQHDGQGGFDGTLPPIEYFDDDRFGFFDVGIGLMWFSNYSERGSFYLGGAAAHVNRPKQSFLANNDIKLYSKYTLHGGGEWIINDQFGLLPGFVSLFQGPSFELNLGTSFRFYLNQGSYGDQSLQFGIWTRLVNNYHWDPEQSEETSSKLGADAVILSARFDYNNFGIGLSYDINVSDLKTASNGRGAFELSLIYYICGQEVRGVYCPKF